MSGTEGAEDARAELRPLVAHLLWCANEGYLLPEDRTGENWLLTPVGSQHPDDEAERPGWLSMADAVLDALGLEQVGWWRGPYQTFNHTHELNPYAPDWRGGECEPVYRLAPRSDR